MHDEATDSPILRFPDADGQAALRRARFMATKPPGVVCHALALRLSKLCFHAVSGFIPDASHEDAECVFHDIIKGGLQEFWDGRMKP